MLNLRPVTLVHPVVLLSLCFSSSVYADDKKPLTFIAGHAVAEAPPYYTFDSQGKISGGIVYDVIIESLPKRRINFKRMPFNRSQKAASRQDFVGCVAPWSDKLLKSDKIFSSTENFVEYHNKVITLSSSKFKPEKISDLKGLRVLAYPGASLFLGDEFKEFTQKSKKYRELEHFDTAFTMLFKKRVDALVMDAQVFIYHANIQGADYYNNIDKFRMADLFAPAGYKIACTDKALITKFDQAKRSLVENGRHQIILEANSQ